MLDYSPAHWFSFVVAAVVVVATPGPDLACNLRQTVKGGQNAGIAASMGICVGAAIHVALVGLGLAALISSFASMEGHDISPSDNTLLKLL